MSMEGRSTHPVAPQMTLALRTLCKPLRPAAVERGRHADWRADGTRMSAAAAAAVASVAELAAAEDRGGAAAEEAAAGAAAATAGAAAVAGAAAA
jgi:hypothetical protein